VSCVSVRDGRLAKVMMIWSGLPFQRGQVRNLIKESHSFAKRVLESFLNHSTQHYLRYSRTLLMFLINLITEYLA
jgi:hypothetical protein